MDLSALKKELAQIEILKRTNRRWLFASKIHRNLSNEPLDFDSNPYLEAIYKDQSEDISVKSSVQSGKSEWCICDALALADRGLRVFYALPTIDIRNNFVRDRVQRVLLQVPYYRQHSGKRLRKREDVADTDNVGLKSFGQTGVLLFVGSNSPVSFLSFPADCVTIDEIDSCHQKNIARAPDRLQASKHKLQRRVSTPTIEDWGIDFEVKRSDDNRWMVKCGACGEHQTPSWFDNVVIEISEGVFELRDPDWTENSAEDIRCYCRKCGQPIDRLGKGEWVARHPDRKKSGYSISQVFSGKTFLRDLWDAFQVALFDETKKQRFYNSLLGEAYTASGAKVSRSILDQCVNAGNKYLMPSRSDVTTMGVDVGKVQNVVICERPENDWRRPVFIGTVPTLDEVHTLIAKFGVQVGVVDYDPENQKAREFQDKANCEIWLCDYPPRPQQVPVVEKVEDYFLVADRTQAMDALQSDLLGLKVHLPGNCATVDGGAFYEQMQSPTRLLDELTGMYRWVQGGKPDHYFHAMVYERLAGRFFVEPVQRERVDRQPLFAHTAMDRYQRNRVTSGYRRNVLGR